jgi:hypothetical protein
MTSGVAKAGPQFTPLIEINDHEGEIWTWWVQIDGNVEILHEIAERIKAARQDSDYYEEYSLPEWPYGERLGQDQVTLLERWSDGGGYYPAHNVVAGVLVRSDRWIETADSESVYERLDALYKGGIDDWGRAV